VNAAPAAIPDAVLAGRHRSGKVPHALAVLDLAEGIVRSDGARLANGRAGRDFVGFTSQTCPQHVD